MDFNLFKKKPKLSRKELREESKKSEGVIVKEKKKKENPEKKDKGYNLSIIKSKPVIGGACIAIAAVIAFVMMPMLNSRLTESTLVVRAKVEIAKGTKITREMLEEATVGGLGLLEKNKLRIADVVEKYAVTDIFKSDLLATDKISVEIPSAYPYLNNLKEGELAISAAVENLEQSVSVKLRAGDIVQFFAILQEKDKNETTAYIPPELMFVEVLAVTNPNFTDVDEELYESAIDNTEKKIATVTVKANERQAAIIARLNSTADLHIALVCRGDNEQKEKSLAKQAAFFLLPEPEPKIDENGGEENEIIPDLGQ